MVKFALHLEVNSHTQDPLAASPYFQVGIWAGLLQLVARFIAKFFAAVKSPRRGLPVHHHPPARPGGNHLQSIPSVCVRNQGARIMGDDDDGGMKTTTSGRRSRSGSVLLSFLLHGALPSFWSVTVVEA
ncbi:hypothetical protein A0H81_10334 [Grifola frondosa]|uniref:Uncharacterized protein n=1 Tax=Grifola frondosa TaxID=5627 RepID=A0A1C7LYW1_GRIFR|nr:hypothetical protein A0H81_10334 [Grifola frondosa]